MNAANLSPRQFGEYFHGSNTVFKPGDTLLPPSKTGNTFWGHDHDSEDKVYSVGSDEIQSKEGIERLDDTGLAHVASESDYPISQAAERMAWVFATQRPSKDPAKRSAVYRVRPDSVSAPKIADVPGEVVSDHAKVLERIDIAPGSQGTFPEVNWNQYARNFNREGRSHLEPTAESVYYPVDYNHPVDEPFVPHEDRMNLRAETPEERRRYWASQDPHQGHLFE